MSSAPTFRRRNNFMTTGQVRMCATNHPRPVPAIANDTLCKSCAFARDQATQQGQATARQREEEARKEKK